MSGLDNSQPATRHEVEEAERHEPRGDTAAAQGFPLAPDESSADDAGGFSKGRRRTGAAEPGGASA